MSEDIAKVIARSEKNRDITIASVIRLEENVVDFEKKLTLTDGERVTLDHIVNKLQMYDAEFHEHDYKLVDCLDVVDLKELEVQQKIYDDHDRKMIYFFPRITKLRYIS